MKPPVSVPPLPTFYLSDTLIKNLSGIDLRRVFCPPCGIYLPQLGGPHLHARHLYTTHTHTHTVIHTPTHMVYYIHMNALYTIHVCFVPGPTTYMFAVIVHNIYICHNCALNIHTNIRVNCT